MRRSSCDSPLLHRNQRHIRVIGFLSNGHASLTISAEGARSGASLSTLVRWRGLQSAEQCLPEIAARQLPTGGQPTQCATISTDVARGILAKAAVHGRCGRHVWLMFLSQTHISMPALMATLTHFNVHLLDNGQQHSRCHLRQPAPAMGVDARAAAIEAGYTRLRPVLITTGAMILGIVGTKTSVAAVANSKPPITARASGAFCSPPPPAFSPNSITQAERQVGKGRSLATSVAFE
jgi:hypothetical protein